MGLNEGVRSCREVLEGGAGRVQYEDSKRAAS